MVGIPNKNIAVEYFDQKLLQDIDIKGIAFVVFRSFFSWCPKGSKFVAFSGVARV